MTIYGNECIGDKYNKNLSIEEIAKLIKKELEKTYKGYKINVKGKINRYSSIINIKIKTNENLIARIPEELREEDIRKLRIKIIEENGGTIKTQELHNKINEYLKNNKIFNLKYYDIEKQAKEISNSYNYDYSNSSIDYFDVNFSERIEIL